MSIRIGTAGWSIPRASAAAFPRDGFPLERYSRVLTCAEINSSFYRSHARSVYARWASLTPRGFRFSVKLPRVMGRKGDGAGAVVYYRLHGSPRKYWSRYPIERIEQWAAELRALTDSADVWCIFDNPRAGLRSRTRSSLKSCLPVEVSKDTKSRRNSQIG